MRLLEKALVDVGFFALTGAGVDCDTLSEAYDSAERFFSLSIDEKRISPDTDGQRGYILSESALGEAKKDHKEFYHIGREFSEKELKKMRFGKNCWPKAPYEFKPTMQKLYTALDRCQGVICSALSEVLQQKKSYLGEMTKNSDSLMRVIHYPANPPKDAIWAAAHTDIDLFTILPRATAKGLQVLNKEGRWIDVTVPDGAFVVNCGDVGKSFQ